jgi:hypothetical protein
MAVMHVLKLQSELKSNIFYIKSSLISSSSTVFNYVFIDYTTYNLIYIDEFLLSNLIRLPIFGDSPK